LSSQYNTASLSRPSSGFRFLEKTAVPERYPRAQFAIGNALQYLRGAGWIKARFLTESTLVESLLRKGWIEQQKQGPKNETYFRLTEKGLEAKKAPVPTGLAERKAKGK
jgi:hypothetical protein